MVISWVCTCIVAVPLEPVFSGFACFRRAVQIDPSNAPHVGGNTWAGGTGGRDTAGLGGVGGPYRLDSGNPIHQVPDEVKQAVPREVTPLLLNKQYFSADSPLFSRPPLGCCWISHLYSKFAEAMSSSLFLCSVMKMKSAFFSPKYQNNVTPETHFVLHMVSSVTSSLQVTEAARALVSWKNKLVLCGARHTVHFVVGRQSYEHTCLISDRDPFTC